MDARLKNSEVYESQLVNGNKVIDSKIPGFFSWLWKHIRKLLRRFSKEKKLNCDVKSGVIRKADLGRNADVSKETERVNDFNELRLTRFITDSRLKDLNDPSRNINFKNSNY